MEKAEQRGWRPKIIETVKSRVTQYWANRDTIPVLNFDLPSDSFYGKPPDSLSLKAKEISLRRKYDARVARAFKRYNLTTRLSFLLPEEEALLRNILHTEYVKDQRELNLIAKAKPFSPVPAAHLELVEFDQGQRANFENDLHKRFIKHNAPLGISAICSEELSQTLFKLAREIKIADVRDQPEETKGEFVERAIMSKQNHIITIHEMLGA